METMLDISDELLREAEEKAARDGTTLVALVEQGLQAVLDSPEKTKPYRFVLKPFKGSGLTDEFKNATPDKWLEAMYGDPPGFDRD